MESLQILGIAGSLREKSYNRSLLRVAEHLCPQEAIINIFELNDIPLYNQDLESEMPKSVIALKEEIRKSDGILFVTPEYSYSISGVLKNAIDWGSRPFGDNAWDGKIAAIMSASSGMLGGSRAQYHLRQIFIYNNIITFNKPEVIVPFVQEKFDEEGNLTDEKTRHKIRELLEALIEKIKQTPTNSAIKI